jgi:hypothetical protein
LPFYFCIFTFLIFSTRPAPVCHMLRVDTFPTEWLACCHR